MSAWGKYDDKTSAGTVTLTAPSITFNAASDHAAGVYTSADHPFQIGDPVVYSNGGGTSVVGLTNDSTYYVTNVTANTFMLATSEANALHNVPTTIASTDGIGSSHTLTLSLNYGRGTLTGSSTNFDPALAVGDVIRVGDQEMIATAVASDTLATVINANPGTTLTAFSGENYTISEKPTAIASVATADFESTQVFGVDNTEIAAGGDNVVSVAVNSGGTLYVEAPTVTIAAPTALTIATTAVSTTAETITATGSKLRTGTKLTYSAEGGTAIGGLTDATAYYVIAVSDDAFKLAASLSDAQAGTAINLSGTGNSSQTFTGDTATATASISGGAVTAVTVSAVGSAYATVPAVTIAKARVTIPTSGVTTTTDTVAYTGHGLSAGDRVVYNNGGGTSATGLTSGTSYYVATAGLTANAFKVKAANSSGTLAATVAVSGTGGQFTCGASSLAAGDRVTITGTLGGTATITGYATGNVYKVSAVTGTSPSVTGFTLTNESGGALTTTAGTLTGLTYTVETVVDISGTGNSAQYFEKYAATAATATAAKGTGVTGSSAAHSGWVKRTVGTGAHAGRVKYEVLVALSKNALASSDAADDLQFPDS